MRTRHFVVTAALAAGFSTARADVMISQYYEGTSFNKYIELHNPTAAPITMTGYRLTLWTNAARENWKSDAAAPSQNFDLSGVTLQPDEHYLLVHNQANFPDYANATANVRNGNLINFNGDDSVVLYNSDVYNTANILDAISISAALQGQDKSFYRLTNDVGYTTVPGENILAFVGTVWGEKTNAEVDTALPADPWYLTAQSAATAPILDTFVLAGDVATTPVTGVTLNFTASGAAATDFIMSEDITFAGATWQQFVTVPKVNLSAGSGVKTVHFKLKNAAGESSVITDTIELTSYTYPGTVVFTQYYEGLANDKHVEIANLSAQPVDLAAWNLVRWTNQDSENWKYTGAGVGGVSQTISLSSINTDGLGSTVLAPGAVLVISNNQASGPAGATPAALTSALLSHNGNDSLALYSGAVGTDTLADALSFTELGNEGQDKSFVRTAAGQGFGFGAGSKIADFPAVWLEVALAVADVATPGQGAHLGTYPDGNVPPNGYDGWAAAYPGIGLPEDDGDGDGVSNLMEYATGSIPNNSGSLPQTSQQIDGPTFTVTWAKNPGANTDAALQWSIEASASMEVGTWSTARVTLLNGLPNAISGEYITTPAEPKVFLRLKVVRTP